MTAGAAMAQTVRMGTEGAYPPYNFINDAGEVDGFERELGDELCKRAELTCEWVKNDWDSIIPNLVSGNYDVIIAGMSITDERDEVIDFTQPYYYTPAQIAAHVEAGIETLSLRMDRHVANAQAVAEKSDRQAATISDVILRGRFALYHPAAFPVRVEGLIQ